MLRSIFLLACLAAVPLTHAAPRAPDTLAQLQALGRDAPCNSDQQCRSLPIGAKACGGPESYLAYSTARTSAQRAQALAERYRKEREAANQAGGVVSDCRFLMDPGAQCRAGTCQLGGAVDALAR
ncbi:MAG: hypothetical protein K0R43_3691 [Pseudoduganella sp.]|jgi:hypothetical protein|nr:hypothetical protein [Pseudoduganella sp.]